MTTSFTSVCMRSFYIAFLSVSMFVFSGDSQADPTLSTTFCDSDIASETRRLQVVYERKESPVPCKVMYEKGGSESELGSARITAGHCERIEEQVVRNLVGAGWQCRHRLTGSAIEPDFSIRADQFSAGLALPSKANYRSNSASTTLLQSQLEDIVQTEHLSTIQKQLQTDLQALIESDHIVDVDLSIAVRVRDASASSGEQNPMISATALDASAQLRRYALVSGTYNSENRAHNLAGQIRRSYPNLVTRVVASGPAPETMFQVVLGTSDSRHDLDKLMQALDVSVRDLLQISNTGNSLQPVRYLPDDWQRFLIANCVSEGKTGFAELADCSGFAVDADSLLGCLGGGSCVPTPAHLSGRAALSPEIDLLDVLGTDNLTLLARERTIDAVRQCLALKADGEHRDAIANCAAQRLLHGEQRFVFDCAQRNQSVSAFLACAIGADVSRAVAFYEQCAVSSKVNLQCLVEMTGSDHVATTADCMQAGSNERITQCLARAGLDTGSQAAQSCLLEFSSAVQQISCITGRHLNTQQSAMLDCSVNSPSAVEFGVCTAEKLQAGSLAQRVAAVCVLQDNHTALELLNCAGGGFAAREIAACQYQGRSWLACFDNRTLLSDIVEKVIEPEVVAGVPSPQIVEYRSNLYSARGGGLSVLHAKVEGSHWLEVKDSVVKPAVREDSPGGLGNNRGLFGFDK